MSPKAKTLWSFTEGYRHRYALAGFSIVLGMFFFYQGPLIIRGAIDGLIDPAAVSPGRLARLAQHLRDEHGWRTALVVFAIGFVVAILLGGTFRYLSGRTCAFSSEKIILRLRERLYSHLQHVPVTYHDKSPTGDL